MMQSSQRRAPPAGSDYLPALDGLRAVSIGLVVLSHAGLERRVPGAFGVTLFFFISGFLITRQLLRGLAAGSGVGFGGFYARRALRLMPAGLAYVLVAGLIYCAAGGQISPAGWGAALFYSANIYDLQAGYHSTLAGVRHPFNVLWSLAIEEHFYLAWPALLAMAWRGPRARPAALALVIGLCGAALAWRLWLFWDVGPGIGPFPYKRLYVGTDTRFDSILWGAFLALQEAGRATASLQEAGRTTASLQEAGRTTALDCRQAWFRPPGLRLAAAALALLVLSFALPFDVVRHALRTSMQGAALVVLVPVLLRARALASPAAVFVGRLSYSIYLWHWGAFAFADWAWPGVALRQAVLGIPLACVLALVSYRAIEQPMLRWRRRAGSHAPGGMLDRADREGDPPCSSHDIGRSATSLAVPSTAWP